MCRDIDGPIKGGILNDAKMVMQSRRAKSAIEGTGTGRGGPPGPKSCANLRSLMRENPMLAVEETANFKGPEVTSVASLAVTVDVIVSRVFANR